MCHFLWGEFLWRLTVALYSSRLAAVAPKLLSALSCFPCFFCIYSASDSRLRADQPSDITAMPVLDRMPEFKYTHRVDNKRKTFTTNLQQGPCCHTGRVQQGTPTPPSAASGRCMSGWTEVRGASLTRKQREAQADARRRQKYENDEYAAASGFA